jgi:tetratricopeptide (TPR) repeat protein
MRATAVALGALLAGAAGAWARAETCGASAYECAVFHVERREFDTAIRYLEPQLSKAPRDLRTLNLLGIALTGAGRKDAANARFREALAIDQRFYPALKNLAVNEYDAGLTDAARRGFEHVLALAPKDEVAHLYLGEIHYAASRRAEALVHYEKSGGRHLQDPRSTLHYGRCLLAAGRAAEALKALDTIPSAAGASLFEAGVALGQARRYADAARFFGAARASHADKAAAGYNQVLMLVEAGQGDAAIGVVRELEASGLASGELLNLSSRAYLAAGRVQEAYDALRQATRLEPAAVENYIDLASICLEHDNFDLGLEIAEIGLRNRPESWMLHVLRGVLLAMKARMGEAEAAFDEARRLAPGEPVPYAALGMAWMQTGQTEKAVEVLRAERARVKDHVVPYILAVALLRSGVEAQSPAALEAVEALRASIRARPDFAPARSELGRLLFKRDELDAAIAELEKAAELDPDATSALYTLSLAYRRKGEREKAQELLARVSRLNAQERGDDSDGELRRAVVRIVREGRPKPIAPAGQP